MKKLLPFGIIVLLIIGVGLFNIQYVNAGHGSGWPGHHRCFIETASDTSLDNSWFEKILDFIWRPRS